MTTTVSLRKLLHKKQMEMCSSSVLATAAGRGVCASKFNMQPNKDCVFYLASSTLMYSYNPEEDAWGYFPASGLSGTFGAGSCSEYRDLSAPGGAPSSTATGGTTTTIITNLSIVKNLKDVYIRCIDGTNRGYFGKIADNTIGSNSVLTLQTAASSAFDSTSVFQIFGGSVWFLNGGSSANATGFGVYDRITNAWTSRSVTSLPTAFATDGQLVSTVGYISNGGQGFVSGQAVSGASTQLTTNKNFLTNCWANFQVRIVSGTGAGQIRSISSNTATVLTVSQAWTTVPDSTSMYVIEGNDDYLYLIGHSVVNLYRYSISANTWTLLSPVAARAAAVGAGCTLSWVDSVQEASWNDGTYATWYPSLVKQNGRYLYSFRGAGSPSLDVYDIAANTWISDIPYGNKGGTFTTGSSAVDYGGMIYIMKDATGLIFKFDVAKNSLIPFVANVIPQGTAHASSKLFVVVYEDGATKIPYLYSLSNARSELVRWLMI